MDVYYIIRNIENNKYWSINGDWYDLSKSKEFNSKESAIDYLDLLDGYFVIEEVYHP